jgi:hypothetical protein
LVLRTGASNLDQLSRRCLIFLVGPTRDNPERIIWQRPLQSLGLIPWRAHPDIEF